MVHTALNLDPDEFDNCQIGVDTDITFCLKEFRVSNIKKPAASVQNLGVFGIAILLAIFAKCVTEFRSTETFLVLMIHKISSLHFAKNAW